MVSISLVATIVMLFAPVPRQGSAERQTSGRDDSLLAIDSIKVGPRRPGPDTLCRVKVRLRNKGKQTASHFVFQVELNGQPVSFHSNHAWALAPGKDTEVQLYNIRTSEPGRPVPKDGRLVVEVRLKAARWNASDDKGTLTPSKDVEPLPGPHSVTLTMSTKKGP